MSAATARQRTSRDVDAVRLGDALARLTRATRRDLALPIGASSIAALVTVERCGPIRLGDLARHEGVTPATLSRIVSVLEDEGYAARSTDADDRRSSWLEITTAGRRLLDGVRRDRAEIVATRLERLTAEQRAALAGALDAFESLAED
ncbi:MAG TPA: MarR family transcriptional regulator [Candidatus Nanopelagicales bacterium]|jgi:DNA-binding MarR family transcriptional regulator